MFKEPPFPIGLKKPINKLPPEKMRNRFEGWFMAIRRRRY